MDEGVTLGKLYHTTRKKYESRPATIVHRIDSYRWLKE